MRWLGENHIPFSIIFTKSDKLKPRVIERNIKEYSEKMLENHWKEMPQIFITSALHKTGGEEVLKYIYSLNESFLGN